MSTRTKILTAAVQLFNQQGTGQVSTNHIAKAAGISPGNLYYHYRNKTEIIGAILDQMYTRWDEVWTFAAEEPVTLDGFLGKLRLNYTLLWEYRFFYREAIVLLGLDGELKSRHIRMTEQRFVDQAAFARQIAEAGILRGLEEPEQLRRLLAACWMIANNWLGFVEMNGMEVTEQQMEEGIAVLLTVLRPYLNEGAKPDDEDANH
ncbi:TetR/AcrR family transcriptional regulator [Paenibacillus daejeonensis]|uniref:TetR/AcrR family transcriptional regulator n=1 Tax=Paenibacillus daejeonensis TaxID=135193 RepID=UPI000376DF81|nr:TetR/AcrR family transcriptional regulator [Paenibacillus daejeonensis]